MPRTKVPKSNVVNEKIWGLPKILAAKDVWVKLPNKTTLDKIPNPLYAFVFPNDALRKKKRVDIPWSDLYNVSYYFTKFHLVAENTMAMTLAIA